MEQDKFCELLREQFIDADEISINAETDFRDLPSWDSLTGMSIIVMIKDEFGVEISDAEFRNCKNVQELFEYIKKNCQ